MQLEMQFGADGGPLFKLWPENSEDFNFLEQFPQLVPVALTGIRMIDGEKGYLNVRKKQEEA